MKSTIRFLATLLLTASCQGGLLSHMMPSQQPLAAEGLEDKQIFHGTSLILQPDYESRQPRNGTVVAASFYCYFGVRGYLSFGWWLPADTDADASRCRPDNKEFDWYEYTNNELTCDKQGCRVHMQNFDNVARPKSPFFEEDYMFTTVTLGERKMEQLGWGLFDRKDGAFAVGTRRSLGQEHGTLRECQEALAMLKEIQSERNITHLPFDLVDVCGTPATRWDRKMRLWL